jgi:hypothetical protein
VNGGEGHEIYGISVIQIVGPVLYDIESREKAKDGKKRKKQKTKEKPREEKIESQKSISCAARLPAISRRRDVRADRFSRGEARSIIDVE